MLKSIAFKLGQWWGRLSIWGKLVVVVLVVAAVMPRFGSTPDSQAPAAMKPTVAQQPRAPASSAAELQAAEAQRLKGECSATLDAKKQEHAALMKAGKHWDAALAIRSCATALGTPDLAKMVRDAEIASYMADINGAKTSMRERASAMQMLARNYPDVGSRYEAQAVKLLADADRKDRDDAVKRKRSEGVHVGMSKEDVLASSWGKPESINTTTTAFGTKEQWVYRGSRNYLYFENGILTAIQN